MSRIVIIGNAGGGKSTLARAIAAATQLPHFELDRLLWLPGWRTAPADLYEAEHTRIVAEKSWVIDGLGRQESISERIKRATEVILIDMPIWMHFWLAAERQIEWSKGRIANAPGGVDQMPPTGELFRTIWEVDRLWMPEIRQLCDEAERDGTKVHRIGAVSELDAVRQRFRV